MLNRSGKKNSKDLQGRRMISAEFITMNMYSFLRKEMKQKRFYWYAELIVGKLHEIMAGTSFGVKWVEVFLIQEKIPQVAKCCRVFLKNIALLSYTQFVTVFLALMKCVMADFDSKCLNHVTSAQSICTVMQYELVKSGKPNTH